MDIQELFTTHLNFTLMIIFIVFYSVLVLMSHSKSRFADFIRNLVYMGSGMLFVFYIFQISYLADYKEFEYLAIFLIALSFRDLLPIIVTTVVDVVSTKLKKLDKKAKSGLCKIHIFGIIYIISVWWMCNYELVFMERWRKWR